MDSFFLYLVIVAGCLLLAVYVYGEDGVGAAAVLIHVVRPDGAILQPLLNRYSVNLTFHTEEGNMCAYQRELTPHSPSSRRREGR
jgi:hypothetical protein